MRMNAYKQSVPLRGMVYMLPISVWLDSTLLCHTTWSTVYCWKFYSVCSVHSTLSYYYHNRWSWLILGLVASRPIIWRPTYKADLIGKMRYQLRTGHVLHLPIAYHIHIVIPLLYFRGATNSTSVTVQMLHCSVPFSIFHNRICRLLCFVWYICRVQYFTYVVPTVVSYTYVPWFIQ